jgi:hypothetical protein
MHRGWNAEFLPASDVVWGMLGDIVEIRLAHLQWNLIECHTISVQQEKQFAFKMEGKDTERWCKVGRFRT